MITSLFNQLPQKFAKLFVPKSDISQAQMHDLDQLIELDFAGYRYLQVRPSGIEFKMNSTKLKPDSKKTEAIRLSNDAGTLVIGIDTDGRVIQVNRAACEILGYEEAEIMAKSWFDNFTPAKCRKEAKVYFEQLLSGKYGVTDFHESPVLTKNGQEKLVAWHNVVLRDQKGVVFAVLAVADGSPTKEAELQAQRIPEESEQKFKTLAEKSPNMIFINRMGRIVYANIKCEEVMGYSREELYAPDFSFFSLIAPDSVDLIRKNSYRHSKGEEIAPYEYFIISKSGKRIAVRIATKLIEYESERSILGIVTDISEYKKTEKALSCQKKLFQQITEMAEEWIWEVDSRGMYTYSSPAIARILGYKPEEIVGKKHFFDLLHPKDKEKSKKESFRFFVQKQSFCKFMTRNLHKNGREVWISSSGVPLLDKEGNLLGYRGLNADITELKDAKQKLRESEDKFNAIAECSHDTIYALDTKGRFRYISAAAERNFGYTQEELREKPLHKYFPAVNYSRLRRLLTKTKRDGVTQGLQTEIIKKDGSVALVSIHGSPVVREGEVIGIRGIIEDISQSKKTAKDLRDFEERFRILFEYAPDPIYLHDLKGVFVDGNRAAQELLGFKKEEIIGKSLFKLKILQPKQLPRAASLLAKSILGQPLGPDEFTLNRKDGSRVTVEIRTFPVEIEGQGLVLGIARDITQRREREKS